MSEFCLDEEQRVGVRDSLRKANVALPTAVFEMQRVLSKRSARSRPPSPLTAGAPVNLGILAAGPSSLPIANGFAGKRLPMRRAG